MRRRWCVAGRLFTISFALIVSVVAPQGADAQSLPAGWTLSNVGSPAVPGNATYNGSTFSVEGAGSRIGLGADQFSILQRQVTGNVTIVARVTGIENTSSSAKAGVMIRESLTAGSRHGLALVTPGRNVGFHRRTATNGGTAGTNGSGSAPVWLRLVRSGNTVTASRSANGTNWTTISSASIPMASAVYVGLAVSSYNTSTAATATFTNVTVTGGGSGGGGGALPSGWSGTDVGGPAVDGNGSYSNGAFNLLGGGTDIAGTSDQFGILYRQVTGDVDVIARVATLNGPDAGSKAGVMVRASLAANAAHVSMFVTRTNGLSFQRRPGTGMSTLTNSGGTGAAPVWVKLERRGTAVTAFRSPDGNSWSLMGSETITLPSTFYVGLAATGRSTTAGARATFTNVTVGAPSSNPLTPPTVALTAPANGATYTVPASMNITANASDSDDGVAMVEFYANGTLLGTDSSSPYAYNWTNVAAGSYSLTAVARDNRGAVATSAARNITVNGGSTNNPPTVSLTAPAAGATYSAPAAITVSANASDPGGSVARVDFYAGSTLIGSDTTSPYSISWNNVGAGNYSLTAVARDNLGATTTSTARSITVNGGQTLPTRAVFNPSSDHASVTRYHLEVFTAGANPNTAQPIASQNLGRPAVTNNECSVDIASLISGLPGGNYVATVYAVGSGGNSPRTVSATFTR